MTETLIQILLGVSILAVIALIFLLVYAASVMRRLDRVTALAEKRAKEVDGLIDRMEKLAGTYSDALRGFLLSFATIKSVSEKIKEYTKEKGESNGQG